MDENERLAIDIAHKYLGRPLQEAERYQLLEFIRDNPDMEIREVISRLSSGSRNPFSRNHSEDGNGSLLEKVQGLKKLK